MKRLSFAISLALMFPLFELQAEENRFIYNKNNQAIFQVRFFNTDDGPYIADESKPLSSTWNLNQQQKDSVLNAMNYWAQIITLTPGAQPGIINVGTYNDENAAATSATLSNQLMSFTQLQVALRGLDAGELTYGSHAQIMVGKMDFDKLAYVPSQLPRSGDADLAAITVHELAHALGMASEIDDSDGEATPAFTKEPFNIWTRNLRDDNGNPAGPGQAILCSKCKNEDYPEGFDVRKDKAYIVGANISEVLAGAMPGAPVKMLNDDGALDDDYMSHLEFKNSLMSHQNYRNYTTFIEAELALLQDMGYQIDRRNFFGFSVYGNGQQLVNQHGYSARNAQGNGYEPNEYNSALLGLGLHVYGSNNAIFQKADLLTNGAGGAGVRIDGENNTLSIESGTRIYADGLNGRGVMFTYGKDHNLIQRGDVQASGTEGVGLSFDFGNNVLGNSVDYRGSYIHQVEDNSVELLPELEGALVNNADISGRVAGQDAAIYIAPNAWVKNINVLNGAKLEGDIISEYAQNDVDGMPRLTQLTFGYVADEQGRATSQTDSNFKLRYDDNIDGINNLAVGLAGGTTSLNGSHKIYSFTVASGATLVGNGGFKLNQLGNFVNHGSISPGNSLGEMSVEGNFEQSHTGALLFDVNGEGKHDTFIVNGNAKLDGQLTLLPARDWYASNWALNSDKLLVTTSHQGDFSEVNSQLDSPTLHLNVKPLENESYEFTMVRTSDAYSRYAQNSPMKQVGRALDQIAGKANVDMQTLYRALDFSAKDGSEIRGALSQLSPAGYSAMVASSLSREQQIAGIMNSLHTENSGTPLTQEDWHSFAIPFGLHAKQRRDSSSVGYSASSYGLIVGAQKRSPAYRNWVFGMHGAMSGQSVKVKSPENGTGKTSAFDIGIHARYEENPNSGSYLFGSGRFGVEDGQMDRRVSIADYSSHQHSDWTGLNGSLVAGGGYRWALSETLSAGPVGALNYTTLSRHGLTESGNDGSRLSLDSNSYNSLRSNIGLESEWHFPLSSGGTVKANLQVTWAHELLDTEVVQNAQFVGYQSNGFSTRNTVTGRDTMGLQAGIRYQINKDVELGAAVSSELFRAGYDSVSGNISAAWYF